MKAVYGCLGQVNQVRSWTHPQSNLRFMASGASYIARYE